MARKLTDEEEKFVARYVKPFYETDYELKIGLCVLAITLLLCQLGGLTCQLVAQVSSK